MTEAYVPKKPNDVIRADDWNNAQIAAREHVLGHSHSGEADQGKKLDGTAIKADAELTVASVTASRVTASQALRVNGREILAELDALTKGVDAVSLKAGGTVGGNLTVQGDVTVMRNLFWAGSQLRADQGGSLELGGNDTTEGVGTPYIDFHYKGITQDFNVRLINDGFGLLSLYGSLRISSELTVNGREILAELDALTKGVDAVSLKAGGTVGGNLTVQGDVTVNRHLFWAGSQLREDQGGSLELGGNDTTEGVGTPYIDFHYKGIKQDFNVRLINDASGLLSLRGSLKISDALTVTETVDAAALVTPSLRLKRKQQWVEVTQFVGGWRNKGSDVAEAAYFKDELGFVHLRGVVTGGRLGFWWADLTTMAGQIFVLPEGYRPQVRYLRGFRLAPFRGGFSGLAPGMVAYVTEPHRVDVLPTGHVCAVGHQSEQDVDWFSLDGITFEAAE
jgi:hypothetical protein